MRVFVPRDAAAIGVGADRVAEALRQAAAARGIDLTLVRTSSRGLFWLEPLVEVETLAGRIGYGPATPADAPAILDGTARHIAVGPVAEIPFLKRQTRLTFARAGLTDPLSLADYRAHGGFRGLERALSLGAAGTIDEVKRSGLRGRGGAGFPTGIKWETVARASAPRKYIVCNADEGDSGTFADRMVLEGDPFLLIEGMTIAATATGATKGFAYIRSEYPHGIAAMEQALASARQENLLGQRGGFRHRDPRRRRRLCLRRGNGADGEH
jgi:formate dehydrogenase iron-sulfur subunit